MSNNYDVYANCSHKQLCTATINLSEYKNKLDQANKKIMALAATKDLTDLNAKFDIEENYTRALSENIVRQRDQKINELNEKLISLENIDDELKNEIKQLKKQVSLQKEMLDRDFELQETEKKFQILKIDTEKIENRNQIALKQAEKLRVELEHATSMYNEKADAVNSLIKEKVELEKYVGVLRKVSDKKKKKEEKMKTKKTWFSW